MRQVGLALAACLVAGTFAAGQESNPTSGTKSKKPSAEAVAARLSEMQKAIEAQQQQIQHLVEQVQSRDGQIQELEQQMSHVQKLGFTGATSRRGRNLQECTGGAKHYSDP
jgi:peptidoglycan hydrolase CwlO-like protein